MDTTVFSYIFKSLPAVSLNEALRYAGIRGETTQEIRNDISLCIKEMQKEVSPKACYMKVPVTISDDEIDFNVLKVKSEKLSINLRDCREAFLFGVTLGTGCDRLINRYSLLSPVKALYFQAVGTAMIESVCDYLCENVFKEHTDKNLKPRFSPGYGDLPLNVQSEFLNILDCTRKIGLSLTNGSMMVPTKSVTAIVGITDYETCKPSCRDCGKNCEFMRIEE